MHDLALDFNILFHVFKHLCFQDKKMVKNLAFELTNCSLVTYILIGVCTGCSIKTIFNDIEEP